MREPLRPSEEWVDIFRAGAASLQGRPLPGPPEFNEAECRAVGRSIQGFQLGESSEGRHLMERARAYASQSGDRAYADAIRLFIAEEQRHARDLALVLDCEGLGTIRRTWPDTVFRQLRKLAGLELSIAVLITAEVIAQVYYAALKNATASPRLRALCDRILNDEALHVRFQAERLAILRVGRGRAGVFLSARAHRAFFSGTCLVVWFVHGRALRRRLWPPPILREGHRAFEWALDRANPSSCVPMANPLGLATAGSPVGRPGRASTPGG